MKVLLMVLMVMRGLVKTDLISSTVSRKVVPSIPNVCLLKKTNLNSTSIRACGVLCSLQTNCLLFCLKGTTCSLYSSQVSIKWPGFSFNPTEEIESYDECYSNWYVNSIAPSLTNISASSVYHNPAAPARNPENAISGFFCKRTYYYCFTSGRDKKPYWRADLGTPKRVSSIIISIRKDNVTHFNDVEITLGTTCSLYSSQVSIKWPGFSFNPTEEIESYDECYSNWYVNSIAPSLTNISASSVYHNPAAPARNPENAISGFFCKKTFYYCFTSGRACSGATFARPHRYTTMI
ncbi:hypothetical protein Pcinc_024140 [Petrolisthes cinctipes]|uniref:F5/8 type C domain-containing protein n=1 Tax=Petrolisthes cinctipes TaxID=88211 RepID=A0AAE1KE06_PETCI|nr:hypothetical protein Pcinc_024140 [Petrolisthes cinctipes]